MNKNIKLSGLNYAIKCLATESPVGKKKKTKISQDGIDNKTAGNDDRTEVRSTQIRRKTRMPPLQELGCYVKSQVTSCSSPEQGMDSWTDVAAHIRPHSPAPPL